MDWQELASSDGRRMRMEEPLRYSDGSGMGASALRDFGRQTRYEVCVLNSTGKIFEGGGHQVGRCLKKF